MIFDSVEDADDAPTIPKAIWVYIFSYCDVKDLCQLARVCKLYKILSENKYLWRRFIIREGCSQKEYSKDFYVKNIVKPSLIHPRADEKNGGRADEENEEKEKEDDDDIPLSVVVQMWGFNTSIEFK
jgi:hypothetical protein